LKSWKSSPLSGLKTEMRKRILFIAAHRPHRSPSQRFRFEQYFSFLKSSGYDYDFSYLISEKDDKIFYAPGNWHTKVYIFFKSLLKRLRDVIRAGHYDIIFVQREAFMTGSTFFEKRFAKSSAKLVFDFDDAIWHFDVSEANKNLGWLKNPGKTAKIIDMADLTIAGNQYLADYAKHHSEKVVIIPTTIDMDEYQRMVIAKENDALTIGWSGSITTIKHFEYAIPPLRALKEKFGSKISFKVIGVSSYRNAELGIQGIPWKKTDEIKELSSFDIGIMPLPDDEWAKGKCGLKGLQYMALEIPAVMSPVGVNAEIIQDGVNGFLAGDTDEWIYKITMLIESLSLRKRMGEQARKTVIEKYSVISQQGNYLNAFNELLEKAK